MFEIELLEIFIESFISFCPGRDWKAEQMRNENRLKDVKSLQIYEFLDFAFACAKKFRGDSFYSFVVIWREAERNAEQK